MNTIRNVAYIRHMIAVAKAAGKGFATNFFLTDPAIERLIATGSLLAWESEGAVIFRRQESAFDRLYYAAADEHCLAEGLAKVPASEERTVVTDVVGRRDTLTPILDLFSKAGYTHHATLVRLFQTVSGGITAENRDSGIELAQDQDAADILSALASTFDEYSDQLPSIDEIGRAIAAGTILVARDAGRVAALYYHDRLGITSAGRYWLVLPEYRGQRLLGDKVLRRYFQDSAACKRRIVWVHESNRPVLTIYQWYGYTLDSIVDRVLVKRH
jgi:hypothetical protein